MLQQAETSGHFTTKAQMTRIRRQNGNRYFAAQPLGRSSLSFSAALQSIRNYSVSEREAREYTAIRTGRQTTLP